MPQLSYEEPDADDMCHRPWEDVALEPQDPWIFRRKVLKFAIHDDFISATLGAELIATSTHYKSHASESSVASSLTALKLLTVLTWV